MIEWLSDWLKQIILVILMAAFADLLLPNNAMQRYIKLIVSLFILMTILSPVVQLLRGDWSGKLTAAVQEQAVTTTGRDGERGQLDEILQAGARIKADTERKSRQWVESELAETAKSMLEQQDGLSVRQVQVKTVMDEQGQPQIGTVSVLLERAEAKDGHGANRATTGGEQEVNVKPMEPIQPVEVNIEAGADNEKAPTEDGAAEAAAGARQDEPRLNQARAEVVRILQQAWGVSERQVRVTFADRA